MRSENSLTIFSIPRSLLCLGLLKYWNWFAKTS